MIVDIARSYIGTKFQHQGRLPGVALDCAGVAVCAAREDGYLVKDNLNYAKTPSGGQFENVVLEHCDKVAFEDLRLGDFMMFAWKSEPQHIAIVSEIKPSIRIIHAYSLVGKVVENSLDDTWRKRLRGCYRLKGK